MSSQTGWHHGQASGVLSVLHKAGRVVRLREVRGRCKVYTLPQFVDERPAEAHGRRRSAADVERQAVLEWLWRQADEAMVRGDLRGRMVLVGAADAIDRGDHLP